MGRVERENGGWRVLGQSGRLLSHASFGVLTSAWTLLRQEHADVMTRSFDCHAAWTESVSKTGFCADWLSGILC